MRWRIPIDLSTLRSRIQAIEASGIRLDPHGYEKLLQACARLDALHECKRIHSHIVRHGFGDAGLFLRNTLLNVYSKCGSVSETIDLFESMPRRNAVSWNVVISGFARSGHRFQALQFFRKMALDGERPGRISFTNALLACDGMEFLPPGRTIHSAVREAGIEDDDDKVVELENSLIAMYGRCGDIQAAGDVFEGLIPKRRTVVSWNSIIAANALCGEPGEAMDRFKELLADGTRPSCVTFLAVLPVCSSLLEVEVLSRLIREAGLKSDVLVATCLITAYGKVGSLERSRRVFEESDRSNVVCWNAMLTAVSSTAKFVQEQRCGSKSKAEEEGVDGEGDEIAFERVAVHLLEEMLCEGLLPGRVTFLAVLNSTSSCSSWKWIHRLAVESGEADEEPEVAAALEAAYTRSHGSRRRSSSRGSRVDQLVHLDVVSWTNLMTSCSQRCLDRESLQLYRLLQLHGIRPTSFTLAVAVEACARLGDYEQGRSIHRLVLDERTRHDEFVATALVNLYSKCGDLAAARAVFDRFQGSTLVLATALIAGYSQNGDGPAALQAYHLMQLSGDVPNHVTFVTILSACSHAGLLDEGIGYFRSMMAEHSIEATAQHYGCVVDLFARLGHLDEAEEVIDGMPVKPGSVAWLTLLGGNRNHGNLRQGERAIGELECGFLRKTTKWRL